MNKNQALFDNSKGTLYIGMMSGTSLDALDAAICRFEPEFELIATHSVGFSFKLKALLMALCQPNGIHAIENDNAFTGLSELDVFGVASRDYARLASQCVHELLGKAGLTAKQICAIGCHGQTVRHRPEMHFSLQLLDANYLAEHTQIAVVSDFRRRDMAVGGQGAPLVPAFHAAHFMDSHTDRVLLNLGGIANITLLPAGKPDKVTGFDTGPANLLMDSWCLKYTGNMYDEGGQWAASGQVHLGLLDKLLEHAYFSLPAPKSTGREDFHLGWLESFFETPSGATKKEEQAPLYLKDGAGEVFANDVQSTLLELTAKSAADAILSSTKELDMKDGEVYVCGGGAYNGYLLARISARLKADNSQANWVVTTSDALGLAPTWVEAAAFAWLARQHRLGLTGNLTSVTGASKSVVLGRLTHG